MANNEVKKEYFDNALKLERSISRYFEKSDNTEISESDLYRWKFLRY